MLLPGFLAASGNPRPSPYTAMIAGIIAIAIGAGFVIVAVRKRRRKTQPDDALMSWPAVLVVGAGMMIFGVMALNEYGHWLSAAAEGKFIFGGWLAVVLGILAERLRLWGRDGFPILTRCPHCGQSLDFRIGRHRCKKPGRGFEVIQKR